MMMMMILIVVHLLHCSHLIANNNNKETAVTIPMTDDDDDMVPSSPLESSFGGDDDDDGTLSPPLESNVADNDDDDDDSSSDINGYEADVEGETALTIPSDNDDDDETNNLQQQQQPLTASQDGYHCVQCDLVFQSLLQLRLHRQHCHADFILNIQELCSDCKSETCKLEPEESALMGAYRGVVIKPVCRCMSLEQMLLQVRDGIQHVLCHCLLHGENIKAFATITVLMHKINITDGSVEKEDYSYFSSKAVPIQTEEDIDDFIDQIYNKLEAHIDKFLRKGSNWIVADVEQIAIRFVKYNILSGSGNKSSSSSFTIPPELLAKKCIINIDSNGNQNDCFKWAIIVSLHHSSISDQKHRLAKYHCFENLYNFKDIKFPATVEDIIKFQKNNKTLAINALFYETSNKTKAAASSNGGSTVSSSTFNSCQSTDNTHLINRKSLATNK